MTSEKLLALSALLVACSSSPPPPAAPTASPPKAEDHHGGHHTLVHRFEKADEWAPKFDDPARDEWQKPQDVVAALELQPGMKVADVGAGTGYFIPHLSRAVGEKGVVYALDVEPDMVRYMKERVAREKLTNVQPTVVPADDLGVVDLDRILFVDVWHHIPNREAYATRLRNALKPGGRVVIVDFTLDASHGPPKHHRLEPEKVVRELAAGGLTASVSPTRLPDQYIVVGTRP
ncbi:MAG: class I SAM-dependent methyltransferase [Labilithrix sp.]|nr:class I SAM-dependent methyltransferase [Labilithrix sp.]MCW5809407.1 class I SAM-dependent methyltransferase [Labilithrix sp.]